MPLYMSARKLIFHYSQFTPDTSSAFRRHENEVLTYQTMVCELVQIRGHSNQKHKCLINQFVTFI